MRRLVLFAALVLVAASPARPESWSVAVDGTIGKVDITQVDGKTYVDVQSLLQFLGYTVSINAEGKVIAASRAEKSGSTPDLYDAALQSLKDIASAAKVGINLIDYSKMVRDAQIAVDRFAEKSGEDNANTKSLRSCLAVYLDAQVLWNKKVRDWSAFGNNIPTHAPVFKDLAKKYPDLKKQVHSTFLNRALDLSCGLDVLWGLARVSLESIKRVPDGIGK